jgi:hypothetical protein
VQQQQEQEHTASEPSATAAVRSQVKDWSSTVRLQRIDGGALSDETHSTALQPTAVRADDEKREAAGGLWRQRCQELVGAGLQLTSSLWVIR